VGTLLVEERRIRDCIERDELVLTTIHGKLAGSGSWCRSDDAPVRDRAVSPLDRLEPEASKVLT
jgi:hypothetical protein